MRKKYELLLHSDKCRVILLTLQINDQKMELQKILHIDANMEHDREVIERLVDINVEGKISAYLKKYDQKEDAEGRLEFFVSRNAHSMFDGKLIIWIDGEEFRYEREDYKNLDDLINNLFKHFKETLSSK